MKTVSYLFFTVAVIALLIGVITPVGIGRCAVLAAVLCGLGIFIDYKSKEAR